MVWRKKKDAGDLFSRVDHYGFAIWPTWLIFIIYFFIFLPLSYYNQDRQDRGIGRERKTNDKLGKKLTQKRKTEGKDTKSAAGKKEENEQKENNNQDKHKLQ